MAETPPRNVAAVAKFTTGSTFRHVVTMTATGSIGLIAIFIVDALNLFYISQLGVEELAAAIGFSATLLFFTISLAIGFTIAVSASVSRALGRGNREDAAQFGGAGMVFIALASGLTALVVWPFIRPLLELIGATGATLDYATTFMQIVLPSTPVIALGMGTTGVLRGLGDARRAMYVTLADGIAAAILDPIFIFGFGLGIEGAAISTLLSRFVMVFVGLYYAGYVHRLLRLPDWTRLKAAARPFFAIGLPAVLTQIATPIGNVFVTMEMARFGDSAVAGFAIVGRLNPVAFGVIFALSGAVGPIFGQNYGARLYGRLVSTLRDSLIFTLVYVLVVWALLALFREPIADLFGLTGEARDVVIFFCLFAAGSFLFNGALFVASAAFNNLGFPNYSTAFNWGRSTLGVIPFVWLGANWYGPLGVVGGWGLGAVFFGVAAAIVAFRVVGRLDRTPPEAEPVPGPPPSANSPFSSGKAATLQP